VFPKRKEAIQIDISTGPMHSALRQAAIVARDESRGVDFTFDSGTVVLSGSTAEVGESRIELPVSYDSEPLTISLDHRFVEDFLKVLSADTTFTLEVENRDAAALFTTNDGFAYVVMPLARDQ
jgi:DNA polymerase-3 subunit beta